MKKSETTACLIAGVLATSILLTGCGGGSGGGMSGLGATGATGAAGGTGAPGAGGTVGDLVGLLGTSGGLRLDANAFGMEGLDLRALTPNEIAGLTAAGITGLENIEVIDRAGEIIGINSPAGAFAIPTSGVTLPGIGGGTPLTLPALPAGIPRVGILGL